MEKNKLLSRVIIIIFVITALFIAGGFIISNSFGPKSLSINGLKRYHAREAKKASDESEAKLRNIINQRPFAANGLILEDQSFLDYCHQRSSGTFGGHGAKQCSQQMTLFFSTKRFDDPESKLKQVFQNDSDTINEIPYTYGQHERYGDIHLGGISAGGTLPYTGARYTIQTLGKIINRQTDINANGILNAREAGLVTQDYYNKIEEVDLPSLSQKIQSKRKGGFLVAITFYSHYFDQEIK